MTQWLLRLIGVSDSIANQLDAVTWELGRPVLFWFGLVLLVPASIFIVRRHRANLPHVAPMPRRMLSACRMGVLLLLVIAVGAPRVRLSDQIEQKPVIAVLIDDSDSMSLPSGPFEDEQVAALITALGLDDDGAAAEPNGDSGDDDHARAITPQQRKRINTMSRREFAARLWSTWYARGLKPVEDRFEVRVYEVAGGVVPQSVLHAPDRPTSADDGTRSATLPGASLDRGRTALGHAINYVLDESAGVMLSGIVLMSDGRNTAGPEPIDAVRVVTTTSDVGVTHVTSDAGSRQAPPVFAVPIGSVRPIEDIAVLDVLAPAQVTKDDDAIIIATIASRGFHGQVINVNLMHRDQRVDQQMLTLRDGQNQQVHLSFHGSDPGVALLTVQVEPQPQEQVKRNNESTLSIRVDTQPLRILFLEAAPRWDFRFLDHALRRDRGVEAQIVIESGLSVTTTAGSAAEDKESDVADKADGRAKPRSGGADGEDLPRLARLPQDAAGFAEYHAVILGDVSPKLLTPKLQQQLLLAVEEEGLGIIVQAGTQHMPNAYWGDHEHGLARLLPVTMALHQDAEPADTTPDRATAASSAKPRAGIHAPAFAPFQMHVTALGATHPAFMLYDSATRNRSVWNRMPPFYWAADARREKPGAITLAQLTWLDNKRPLIAEHMVGQGRVIFIGIDSTYRWRRNIGSHLFTQFWGQAIRRVARSTDRGADHSWLVVSTDRVEPQGIVVIELYAVDDEGHPVDHEQVNVQVTGPIGAKRLDEGVLMPLHRAGQPGFFRGMWRPDEAGEYELVHTGASDQPVRAAVRVASSGRELLRPVVDRDALGAVADATGGALLEPDQLHTLVEALKGRPKTIPRIEQATVWDNWLMLVMLISLYCADVGIRRLTGVS